MKRSTVIVDRLACAVAGLALLSLGVAGAAWARGDLTYSVSTAWSDQAVSAAWWPFALGAVAIVLVAVGIAWLFGHRLGQTPGPAALPGSTGSSLLTVDLDSAAEAAAASLGQHPMVLSAAGRCRADRGQKVIEVHLEIDPATDLTALSAAVERTRADLAIALAGVPFSHRVLLRAARRRKGGARVA
ncbi:hypothetical protein BH11ACT6_BH11ACT6_00170 [soil metagenome]